MAYDIHFRSSVSVREEGNMTVKTPASSDPPTQHLGRMHKALKSPASSVPPWHQLEYMHNLQSKYDFEAWKPYHEGT